MYTIPLIYMLNYLLHSKPASASDYVWNQDSIAIFHKSPKSEYFFKVQYICILGQQNKSLILTDVGIKLGHNKVEIRLKGPNVDRSKRLLDVLVNGQFILFDDPSLRWQDFGDKQGNILHIILYNYVQTYERILTH